MLSASVGGLCGLLKSKGPSNVINVPLIHGARLRVVLLWLLLEWRSSGVAELLKLLHILSGVNAGWQRTARTRSSSAKPSGLACAAAAPVAVAAAAAAAGAERSGAVARRGCRRRALLLTTSDWKADAVAEGGRVRGLPVAVSACPPHRPNASPHAPSLPLVPHHVGAHAAMCYTPARALAREHAHTRARAHARTHAHLQVHDHAYTPHVH